MLNFIKWVGIIGFFICLSIMYMTNLGVRGIRQYDPSFQSPDMKFHYKTSQITETLEQIGEPGRAVFQKYLILDSVFTLCFFIVMMAITGSLFSQTFICNFMVVICILRGIFDLLENSLLFIALKHFPGVNETMITVCSCFTSLKFVMLFIWLLAVAVQVILNG